jgi:hypothetical protein
MSTKQAFSPLLPTLDRRGRRLCHVDVQVQRQRVARVERQRPLQQLLGASRLWADVAGGCVVVPLGGEGCCVWGREGWGEGMGGGLCVPGLVRTPDAKGALLLVPRRLTRGSGS